MERVKNSKPKPKEKWTSVVNKGRSNKASNGVLCGSKQMLLHEMRKKQQQDENARER